MAARLIPQRVEKIFARFRTAGRFVSAEAHGSGHIHDTFHVMAEAKTSYILQRINETVFADVAVLMHNVWVVSQHLAALSRGRNGWHQRAHLKLVETTDGESYLRDGDGRAWRAFEFIPDSISYDAAETPELAYQAGLAYGEFLVLMSTMPVDAIQPTIPDFHNLESRLKALGAIASEDPYRRAGSVPEEIFAIHANADSMLRLHKLAVYGTLPIRITHNDTKINNILFSRSGKALAVIDLDTVMPGIIHYDFGDAIRTGASMATEDTRKLASMGIDLPRFRAFTSGYIKAAARLLTEAEIAELAFSPQVMTFIMAVRFLTDYLAGDRYYTVFRPGHNRDRARAQLRLLQSMKSHASQMAEIVAHEVATVGVSA